MTECACVAWVLESGRDQLQNDYLPWSWFAADLIFFAYDKFCFVTEERVVAREIYRTSLPLGSQNRMNIVILSQCNLPSCVQKFCLISIEWLSATGIGETVSSAKAPSRTQWQSGAAFKCTEITPAQKQAKPAVQHMPPNHSYPYPSGHYKLSHNIRTEAETLVWKIWTWTITLNT